MKNSKILIPLICLIAGVGIGFFGSNQYRNFQMNKLRGNFGGLENGFSQRFVGGVNGTRTNGQNGGFRGGAVMGSIISTDDKSITVKLQDGSTKIILFSDSTKYSNSVSASKTDLKNDMQVSIFGTPNSDGSVTATNIQLNVDLSKLQNPAIIKQ